MNKVETELFWDEAYGQVINDLIRSNEGGLISHL